MGRAALVVSAGVLLSRILGMLREVALADLVGANSAGDAYRVAFIIPDFLNYLLAGGYMAITFIPILSRYFANDDEPGAWAAFIAVARPVGLVMAALVGIGMLVADPVIDAVTALGPAEVKEAARLTRIILPAQFFFVIGTLLMAVQYARERFLIPTLAPIVYNLMIILGGLVLTDRSDPTAEGFAWGVLAGAIIGNFLIQAYGARQEGLRLPSGIPLANPIVREYLVLALPLMLGQSLVLLDESFIACLRNPTWRGPHLPAGLRPPDHAGPHRSGGTGSRGGRLPLPGPARRGGEAGRAIDNSRPRHPVCDRGQPGCNRHARGPLHPNCPGAVRTRPVHSGRHHRRRRCPGLLCSRHTVLGRAATGGTRLLCPPTDVAAGGGRDRRPPSWQFPSTSSSRS